MRRFDSGKLVSKRFKITWLRTCFGRRRFNCIDEVSAHAVLAFFIQPGKSFYRLTYAAKKSRLGDDMKVWTEQTAPRRFTYILGEGESCRTAAERFG